MSYIRNMLSILLGAFYCSFLTIFLIVSIPVYIFRAIAICLAKLFRPELGAILSGQSGMFVSDYMAETPPRSNVAFAMIFEGALTLQFVKSRIMKNWILSGEKMGVENFQQYPHNWLGFTFWRDASKTFSIDNHMYSYSGKEILVTDQQLSEIMEYLVNKRWLKFQSPWELVLIENYSNPQVNKQQHSVLIFNFHHCLTDGFGVMTALMNGLFEQTWIPKDEAPLPKRPMWKRLTSFLTFPISAFYELVYFFSHTFRIDPFKVSDEKKEWHQVYARSGPIQIQHIKDIKNAFGVSYTSVLLSAMSAAVHKTVAAFLSRGNGNSSMLCLTLLPGRGVTQRKTLSNHVSAALLDLPVGSSGCIERLKNVNRMLEKAKSSVVPILSLHFSALLGGHTYLVNRIFTFNRMVPIALTNFVAVPTNVELEGGIKWVNLAVATGGHIGETGLVVASTSHGHQTEIQICAERALMSQKQAEKFLYHVKQEIEILYRSLSEDRC